MKALAALAVLPTALLFAVPAHADDNDRAFLMVLDQSGISYSSSAYAINTGHQVCNAIDGGSTLMHEVDVLYRTTDASFTSDMAGSFVGDSIASYCPWDRHLIDAETSSGTGQIA